MSLSERLAIFVLGTALTFRRHRRFILRRVITSLVRYTFSTSCLRSSEMLCLSVAISLVCLCGSLLFVLCSTPHTTPWSLSAFKFSHARDVRSRSTSPALRRASMWLMWVYLQYTARSRNCCFLDNRARPACPLVEQFNGSGGSPEIVSQCSPSHPVASLSVSWF